MGGDSGRAGFDRWKDDNAIYLYMSLSTLWYTADDWFSNRQMLSSTGDTGDKWLSGRRDACVGGGVRWSGTSRMYRQVKLRWTGRSFKEKGEGLCTLADSPISGSTPGGVNVHIWWQVTWNRVKNDRSHRGRMGKREESQRDMPCSVNCDNWLDERDVVRQSWAAAVLINAN